MSVERRSGYWFQGPGYPKLVQLRRMWLDLLGQNPDAYQDFRGEQSVHGKIEQLLRAVDALGGIAPYPPELGDGWTSEGEGVWQWQVFDQDFDVLDPGLVFKHPLFISGRQYRIAGTVEGMIATGDVQVYGGGIQFGVITGDGDFSFTGSFGGLDEGIEFVIVDNTTVIQAILSSLTIEDVTV